MSLPARRASTYLAEKHLSPLQIKTIMQTILGSTPITTVDEALDGCPSMDKIPVLDDLLFDFPFAVQLTDFGLVYRFLGNESAGHLLHIATNIFNNGLEQGFGQRQKDCWDVVYYIGDKLPKDATTKKPGFADKLVKGDEMFEFHSKLHLGLISLSEGYFKDAPHFTDEQIMRMENDISGLLGSKGGVLDYLTIKQSQILLARGQGFDKIHGDHPMRNIAIYGRPIRDIPLYEKRLPDLIIKKADGLIDAYRTWEDDFLAGKLSKERVNDFYETWSSTLSEILVDCRDRLQAKYL
ncbi:MAG: hypothetical protein V1837_06835 [Candidatus Woesearchaeota archaeon]